jgi:hypothetical protein
MTMRRFTMALPPDAGLQNTRMTFGIIELTIVMLVCSGRCARELVRDIGFAGISGKKGLNLPPDVITSIQEAFHYEEHHQMVCARFYYRRKCIYIIGSRTRLRVDDGCAGRRRDDPEDRTGVGFAGGQFDRVRRESCEA